MDYLERLAEKADVVLAKIKRETDTPGIVPTKDVLFAVQDLTGIKIGIAIASFSRNLSPELFNNVGAIMTVSEENGHKTARIMINADAPPIHQRFLLVRELGNLMTGDYRVNTDTIKYMLSIDTKQNLFALKVLIPYQELHYRLKRKDNLKAIAKSFGVTKEDIIARLELGR